MSLITRCPACQTSFRVVPDQLRMSDGWARCGQCSEVFDASSNLQREAPVEPEPESTPPQFPATGQSAAAKEAVELTSELQEIVAARSAPIEEPVPVGSAEVPRPRQSEASEPAEPNSSNVSFLRSLPGKARPQKLWVRTVLVVASLVLLLGLIFQFVLHERDRIATLSPQTKPILETVCGYLNCAVSTLQQIDSIVVESSSFTRIRNDNYRLNFVIKNTAPYPLAMPALELTLTDAQDQAVLRRVLPASDFNAGANPLAAHSEWSGSVAISARSNGGAERIAGYRVMTFYP